MTTLSPLGHVTSHRVPFMRRFIFILTLSHCTEPVEEILDFIVPYDYTLNESKLTSLLREGPGI